MAQQILLTTTGTLTPVVIDDFGARSFAHPTVDFDLLYEFTEDEIRSSVDLQAAIDAGYITLSDENGNNITDVSLAGKTGIRSELLTYSDTANKVIGPLAALPADTGEVVVFAITGILQEIIADYTVREVTGGTAPGSYVCVSTTSSAPGGGIFFGGSNPGTGIDAILVNGDKVRVTYSL